MATTTIEKAALDLFTSRQRHRSTGSELDEYLVLGIFIALKSVALVRRSLPMMTSAAQMKADGSPTTALERQIEQNAQSVLREKLAHANFVGEETGGRFRGEGLEVALDPIDGTWAMLSDTETSSTTLTFFQDGQAIIGIVANAKTTELIYGVADGPSRLLQISAFESQSQSTRLPFTDLESGKILVNIHPARSAGEVVSALYQHWQSRRIAMVRSPGGSPAWALAEAAKGHFTYLNLWDRGKTSPYDLAAGTLIVERSGGRVVDERGQSIDPLHHSGPFVAGVDPAARKLILGLLNENRT